MKFALCESLPVPVLWGGNQMRGLDVMDYHRNKVVSMELGTDRMVTPSTSWLAATSEIAALSDPRLKKAYKDFVPSHSRLSNMIRGERRTINMPAVLYPGRDSVVRIGRHNARIDEGYNEVVALNGRAVEDMYGGRIVVIDSVANGEAFIIVRNQSDQAISLASGALDIAIRPAVCLPRILSAADIQKANEKKPDPKSLSSMATLSEHSTLEEEIKNKESPTKFFSWNCNGLGARMKRKDLEGRFYAQIEELRPQVISLQEVRFQCEEGLPGVIRRGSTEESMWEEFMAPLRGQYDAYLSLSSKRYGGQAVLVKKSLSKPLVSYNMGGKEGHYGSGRFIKLEFGDLVVTSVYAPFNGVGKPEQLSRRQQWDADLLRESAGAYCAKGRVMLGDFNAVYRESDMTDGGFWLRQGDQTLPIGDRGFGGTTANERRRFAEILECGELSDTFTAPSGRKLASRFTFRGQGHFYGKGLKLDYILTDDTIMVSGGVRSSRIVCGGMDRDGFMGSDHAPMLCELHPHWKKKRANLAAHYGAAKTCPRASRENFSTEDLIQVERMFVNTTARTPKSCKVEKGDPAPHPGNSVKRPSEFPEKFWNFVDPEDRQDVHARFASYKDKDYLLECVQKVVEELDVQKRDEYFSPDWNPGTEEEPHLQEDFLRAQALAHLDVFFFPDPSEVKMAKDVIAEVETTDNKPFKCKSRKLSVVQQAFLQAKTNIMMRMGQLEDAKSDWCHGLVLVPYEERINAFMERHGDKAMELIFADDHEVEVATFFRLCIDLRMLNAKTVPDRFPLPRIDDLLESVPRGCGRYSISDIADAFFKCELKKEDRHKTAFKTHNRHLQFSVLPQGFINSPSVFCRLIARTFEGVDRAKFSAYIDDVLNHTEDFKDHLAMQRDLYSRLRGSQLTLKLSKTHLNYSEVKFLGHILTKDGRLPDPKAVEAIQEWKDPTTAKEVRSFLGATLYYREYIYNYSDMAMPLYDLIRKGVVVESAWDPVKHGEAIQQIKDALTSKPVLMQVDNTRKFRLKVDACRVGRGIGSILEQQNDAGKWQPVSYYSSSLSKEERNYSATELECKALHDCILHYAVYLKYIPHFEVFSDHNALRYMVHSENATTNGRLMRYLLDLQEYNFSIYYRRGTENCDADAVSRLKRTSDVPVFLTEDELSEESGVVSRQLLQRARALDTRNKVSEKTAEKLLRRLAKEKLTEMATLNDHILAEGVENLESESGRSRFFENIKAKGLTCSREAMEDTLEAMAEDRGTAEAQLVDEAMQSEEPAMVALVNIWLETGTAVGQGRVESCLNATTSPSPRTRRVSYLEAFDKADSAVALPDLLSMMVESVKDDIRCHGQRVQTRPELKEADLKAKRRATEERALALFAAKEADDPRVMQAKEVKQWALKEKKSEDIQEELKILGDFMMDEGRKEPDDESAALVKILVAKVIAAKRRSPRRPMKEKGTEGDKLSRSYDLRKRVVLDYTTEVKSPPNWIKAAKADKTLLLDRHPVNSQFETIRKKGYGQVEVRRSLVPGDSGQGLFAVKKIEEGAKFCSYEGVEVTEETLCLGYGNRDYVASAVKDHRTMEMIYIDGEAELSCYGRFCQDPIDDHLVNAKILWREGKMVLVAMVDIEPGDEIYVEYGLDYWKDRLHFLHPELRKRISARYKTPTVRFEPECTVCDYVSDSQPSSKDGLRIKATGAPLQRTPDNLLTRTDRYVPELAAEEGGEVEEEKAENVDERIFEELSFENVNECKELADELQFLTGRKFRDEGRLYEIYQVRYDPEWEHIIGFRRGVSGKTHKEDGAPFLVYGREGLYELSERYLLTHPEDRDETPWPKDNVAWARLQAEDEELSGIMTRIRESGGMSLKEGRHKYALEVTDGEEEMLLVRVIMDTRKGVIHQTMVPQCLTKATLKVHHEGFGHMGANRMLETIRLRYFWSKMDQDITKHSGDCLNCKLRKTYQRKPKVPIMKYDDTARPLDRVHVDLTGPLPTTKGHHKYIMVIKDYLSKYVWLIPLKSKGSVEVAEAFVGEFVCQAGIPGRVVSDKGNEFVNQLLANVARILSINRISTTPYNPRSDGFVENHNKTLKDQLYHYVDNLKQDDWDVYLPTVQLMYNTTVSLSTGYTPMLLMTGREARMPSFSHMASVVDSIRPKDRLTNELVLKMVETMRGYHDHALLQTVKNKGRLNMRIHKPMEFVEYEPGQEFLKVKRPTSSFKSVDEKEKWKITMKLLERYEGPYKIIRKINPVLYDADIEGKEVRVHASNMKPF